MAPRGTPKKPATRARRAPPRARATQPTGAEVLVAQLEALGVDVVFGIPGVHNLAIFDAVRRAKVRVVLTRHEQTCVYAADAYARATGRLGVALTTTGPGVANTAAAMGEARMSRSPVLQIATQVDSRILSGKSGRFSLHESPHQREMLDGLSLWTATAARAEAIPSLVLRGARAAFEGRRGPAFLDIPFDLLDQPVAWKPQGPMKDAWFAPEPRLLERAVQILRRARTPVIWAGGGVISSGASDALAQLAEVLDAPVVTTFAGKGALPATHPLLVGLPPHQPEVTDLLRAADALVVLGSDLDGMNTMGWRLPLPKPRIAINTIAEDGRRNYACDVVIESDAREGIEALLPLLDVPAKKGRGRTDGQQRVAGTRKAAEASIKKNKDFAAPYRFVRQIEAALPDDAFVVADMAMPGYWAAAYLRTMRPRAFAYPLGWGTLGFGLPAAIGPAAAGRRTLVLCGDAGLMFGVGELATAAQEKLPICVLVVNDGGYGMLRFDEQERFGDTFAASLQVPDLVALAGSFGVPARSGTSRDVPALLAWGLAQKGPALIEVRAKFAPPLTTSPRWPMKGAKEARP